MAPHSSQKQGSVLFVLPWRIENSAGGVNVVVQNLYKNFKKNGELSPIICSTSWGQKTIIEMKSREYSTIEFDMVYPIKGVKSYISFLLKLPLCLYRLQKYIKQKNIKVINFHYPSRTALCVAILRKFKCFKGKLILSFHGTDAHSIQNIRPLDSFIYQYSDNIITCSEALCRTIESKIPQKFHEKIKVIHNAIDPEEFFKQQKTDSKILDILANRKYILSVARFDPNKGLAPLIKAFHVLTQEDNEISLILVGASTAYVKELKKLACSLNIDCRIIFYEDIPNEYMGMFYEHASVFILNSRKEGFPLVILEAALYENVVIATATGGVPEIILNNKNGILIPVSDSSETLCKILKGIFYSPQEKYRYGKALYNLVTTEFSWEKKYQAYLNLFLPLGKTEQ